MTITTANCPSCGAPIVFKLGSSIVVVCEYCDTAVARTDRDVRNLGKVADLIDTRSPLELGVEGRLDGKPFVLTGRAQIAHPAGGVWDEWYATFADGRTGWLAEAQGRFYLTFLAKVDPASVPPASAMRPGTAGQLPGAPGRFVCNEISTGRYVAAKGEIPFELVPGEEFAFADLTNENGDFATIDYGETPPLVFYGREVTLREIGIRGEADEFSAEKRKVGVVRLACPKCGAPVDLRTPEAERTTCPSCAALLDVDKGNLRYLRTLSHPARPPIAIGSKGKFAEGELTVVGYMTRSTVVEGTTYQWEEYLLYNPQLGFRWLVQDSGHWSYVTPLSPGQVFDGESVANYKGQQYKRFQTVTAKVDSVYGEFYWRVEVGETTGAQDFVNPPEILSQERSGTEVNWSYGVYMPREEIARIFDLKTMPMQTVRAGMAQPNPHLGGIAPWVVLILVALAVGMVHIITAPRRTVLDQTFQFNPLDSAQGTQVVFTDPIDVSGYQNIKISASAPVDNSWAYLEGDFVNEDTGLVQNFSVPIEYYHGYEGGESWSEGSQEYVTHISALPAGKYSVRLEGQWEKWQQPMTVKVRVVQGVPRLFYLGVLLGLLSLGPLVILIRRYSFERARWSESMYNPYQSSD